MEEPIATSQVRIKKVDSPAGKTIEITNDGTCSGYLREFESGNKYCAVVDEIHMYSSQMRIVMDVEEWIYNTDTGIWNQNIIYSKKYDGRKINVGMNILVRQSDGKYEELLTEEEKATEIANNTPLIPEFTRYFQGLILPYVIPPVQNVLEQRWVLDVNYG